jgi:hypothetical protein
MAIPVLAEIPGQQELHTRDHGTVKVAGLSFMDGGFHIVKCPNGAYMHSNGLPIVDIDQLRAAIPKPFLEDAENWFERRHEQEDNPPQPIGFHPQGYPIFADGSIPDFSDLYAYFAPGAILTAAIVALQQYIDRTPGFVPQKLKAVPPPPDTAAQPPPDPAAAGYTAPPDPAPSGVICQADQIAILTARLEAAEAKAAKELKARLAAEKAAKARKTASKDKKAATPKTTTPESQEG